VEKPCYTWYKVVGPLQAPNIPLVTLHGGPGACHDYLLPLTDLRRTIVLYDQLGNGKSTHLPEKAGDEDFWTIDLFKRELDNLLLHLGLKGRTIDLYGQSWGGMLGAEWAAALSGHKKPVVNLRRLILSNSPASTQAWVKGMTVLRKKLPQDIQDALDRAEKTGEYDSPEYEAATEFFYKRHLSLARPFPAKEIEKALEWLTKDKTVYGTMCARPSTPIFQHFTCLSPRWWLTWL
jgi:proline-specific peptidase